MENIQSDMRGQEIVNVESTFSTKKAQMNQRVYSARDLGKLEIYL